MTANEKFPYIAEPLKTTVIEFSPSPYSDPNADHAQSWKNMRDIIKALGYNHTAMYTGVKGADCFFELEVPQSKHAELVLALTTCPLVNRVELANITILDTIYMKSIRIHLPLAEQKRRRR